MAFLGLRYRVWSRSWTSVSGVSVMVCCPSFTAYIVQRFLVKLWLIRIGEFPHFQNLSPCSWYLTLFEDKQGFKSGKIDMLCFWHILTMFSELVLSLYRVFLVLFESSQVWSCIGWEIDHLEQKSQKEPELEIFTSGTTLQAVLGRVEQPKCMFQRQTFLRKLQVNSGFALISLYSPKAVCGLHISSFSFSLSLFFSTLFLETKKPDLSFWRFVIWYFVKGEGSISLTVEKIAMNPLFISFINM